MVSVNIRELMHNFSKYLKDVKEGEQILVMERNVPVAEIIPYNPHVKKPGWKREIKRIKVKGEALSETVVRMRREEQR
ncbi:MAG: type II toxin-antitoxin system Phd/YefM family antitoxin [Candidatus Omnitrophota bacterium]